MQAGAVIDYVIRWLGLPIRWRTIITSYDRPHGFVDEQARGPYKLWRHEHFLKEVAGGTEISDCVTYILPLGPLGEIAHALLVKRQLLAIFRYRQRAVRDYFQIPAIRFDDPVIAVS